MKKIFLLALFLINFLSFSQRAVITDPDGNPIEITPIDPDPIDPIDPVDPTPTIPSSLGYHDTQGKFEISNNGQATYTLPIALPPSIQSVGPTINLVYSSGQMGGIAGQGWNINSISSIARIATRRDIDGFVDGVDFDVNDKLALDGQRLILVSGAYWAAGSVYKTEVLSNSKIELIGSGTSMYFIVTAPDGSRSWYGNFGGQNATDLTAFYIVRFEDTNGNFITYHYNKPFNKALCINEVKFSANVNGLTTPLNRIKFNYVLAKRAENVYIKGVKHEKVELLKNIVVYTNNLQFKKYVLTHDVDPKLGYERVVQLQEFNSNDEAANPVVFEYPTTTMDSANSETLTSYTNNLNFNDVELSGDFDGDGRLDFVTENSFYRNLFQGSGGQTPINLPFTIYPVNKVIAVTSLRNNKLDQKQSIAYISENNDSCLLKYYNFNSDLNVFELTSQTNLSFNNLGTRIPLNSNCNGGTYRKKMNKYLEGDFNGDGISEILFLTMKNEKTPIYSRHVQMGQQSDYVCYEGITYGDYFEFFLINDPSNTNLSLNFNPILNSQLINAKNYYIADFNSDGKSDILAIKQDNTYVIATIKLTQVSPFLEFEIIGQGILDKYSDTKQILFGDYNGDGKTDIMLPDTEGGSGHTLWHIYYSNPNPAGGVFFVKESHNIVEYWPNTGGHYNTQTHFSNYYALDTNGDGKSDIVRVWRKHYKPNWTINDHNTQWTVTTYANNISNTSITGNKFTFDYSSPHNHDSDSPDLVIPIVSSYKRNGLDRDLVLVHNHYDRIFYVKFKKDVSEDIRLKKIVSSGGNIVDQIEYKAMEPNSNLNDGQGTLNGFYSSNNSVSYPYVEIKKLPLNFLVSKITNTTEGIIKYQDFRYHGLVVNLHGLGTIGFNKTARSTWYLDPFQKRIWNISENDFQLRCALIRSYNQLLNNGYLFSFENTANPIGIVNSTVNTFTDQFLNGNYKIQLNTQIVTDFITGVVNETNYVYDSTYLLPINITTKNYTTTSTSAVGTKVTTTVFDNNSSGISADYYIGRPLETTSTTTAYGGTSTSKELFTYSSNKLIKTEKKGNTSDSKFLVEEFEYNPVGNVIKKTLSSSGYNPTETFTPRVTEYTYDSTERFVKTVKDIEGLIATNVSFHPLYGIVTETLSPYGLTTKVEVDYWGKVFKSTDYLGKNTTIAYSKSSNEYTTTKSGEDGSVSVLISDALGRPKKSGQKNIDGTWSYKVVEYDYLGRKFRESEPFSSSPTLWTTFTYDDYSRLKTQTYPTGAVSTLNYSNTIVHGTVDYLDGGSVKFSGSTKNANGHVISSSDNGGTITYQYYADGNLKSSNYSGTIVSMEYDEWGRKKKLNDPSAGEYTYTYNAIGELLTETTPNGTTTNTYDDFGNIDYSTIVGTNTNSKTDYTYDNTTKLLTNLKYEDFNNGGAYDEYSYAYDSFKRLYATTENKFGSFYQRVTIFDAFGRPEKESYNAVASGKQSAKWVKNTYKNGYHWQILDDATSQVLWQANTVNERGQLLTANLGNGIAITNAYDSFGFVTQNKHDKTGVGNVM